MISCLSVALGVFYPSVWGWAEVRIQEIRWQLPLPSKRPPVRYQDITAWLQPPAARTVLKPRPVVKLFSPGGRPASGLVLRYAVSARLAPLNGDVQAKEEARSAMQEFGGWTVPFWVEERRIPWLRGDRLKEVPLHRVELTPFLRRIRESGYWPEAIRVQVMVEPKKGDTLRHRIGESVLPVRWE